MNENLKDYELILRYIKQFGTTDFEKLLYQYYHWFKDISKENILQRELLSDGFIKNIKEDNKRLITYLKNNKMNLSVFDLKFLKFVSEVKNNRQAIDTYLENVKQLLHLGVTDITTYDDKNCFCFVVNNELERINTYKIKGRWIYIKEQLPIGIRKVYTDGFINFSDKHVFGDGTLNSPYFIFGGFANYYYVDILHSNWILDVVNMKNEHKISLHLKNSFCFDKSHLPDREEIDSLELPKTLTNYYKELILKKSK